MAVGEGENQGERRLTGSQARSDPSPECHLYSSVQPGIPGQEGTPLTDPSSSSSRRLLQLCTGYFFFYALTGILVKYFQGRADAGFPGMNGTEFLVYSTVGGNALCLLLVLVRGWYRLESNESVALGPIRVPREFLYILPSGVCTAVVIPTTTLMYSLPISVMVAMVMMRGSVIIISRLVDAIQIHQGILRKRVHRFEDLAVVFALLGVSVEPFWGGKDGGFDFLKSPEAVAILGSYIIAYAIRIYLMNYFKNTRREGVKQDNAGFFGVEQLAASVTLILAAGVLWKLADSGVGGQASAFREALLHPHPAWSGAMLAGTSFGIVAFFSVFIFMFQGRTATFAGLVNRLTSLMAGTVATLAFAGFFGGKYPKVTDWVSLAFILMAVVCLTQAERSRAVSLKAG